MALYLPFRIMKSGKLITVYYLKDRDEYEFTSSREDEFGNWCHKNSLLTVGKLNLSYFSLSNDQIDYILKYIQKWNHTKPIIDEIIVTY